jgi:6-phosphogluconolactonase (cycloisomerase 2 family)
MASTLSSLSGISSVTSSAQYYVTANTYSVAEGTSVNISINTVGVPDNTIVYYSLIGSVSADDITTALSGEVNLPQGSISFSILTIEDFTVEGTETIQVVLRTESQSGPIVATSQPISIIDISTELGLIESYSNTNTIYLNSTNLPDGMHPYDISFSSNGTLLYVLTADELYEFSLSAAFDTTTIPSPIYSHTWSNDNVLGSTTMRGIYFADDGTKLYVCSSVANVIHQYAMSTPWDISTLSYSNLSFDTTTQAQNPQALYIRYDGTKLYVLDDNTDAVYQYTLGTAWDISTATYDNKSFSQNFETQPNGLSFSSDGSRFIIVGQDQDVILECYMSTPWDLSTARSETVRYFDGSVLGETIQGVYLTPDLDYVFFINGSNPGTVIQFLLPDPQTRIVPENLRLNNTTDTPTDLVFSNTGGLMYVLYDSWIEKYSLSDPFNVSSAVYTSNIVVSSLTSTYPNAANASFRGLAFSNTGTTMFISAQQPEHGIYQYQLSTDYDVGSTITYQDRVLTSSLSVGAGVSGLRFSPNGSIAFVSNTGSYVNQFALATPWTVNTAVATGFYFSNEVSGDIICLEFSELGSKLYLHDNQDDKVFQYQLTEPYTVNTAIYDNLSINVAYLDVNSRVFSLNNVTKQFYLAGIDQDTVAQYNFSNSSFHVVYSSASVDEGETITFRVFAVNPLADTDLYYTLSGVSSADIVGGSLSGLLSFTNNVANVSVTFTEDSATEGNETVQLFIRLNDNTGPIVGKSLPVTVVDTSTAPYGSAEFRGYVFRNGSNNQTSAFTWVVPDNVTSISIVTVGAGADGKNGGTFTSCKGGGGGALSYRNNVSVTPGESLVIRTGRVSNGQAAYSGYSTVTRAPSTNYGSFIVGAGGGRNGSQGSAGLPVQGGVSGTGGGRILQLDPSTGAISSSTTNQTFYANSHGGGAGGTGGAETNGTTQDGAPRFTGGGGGAGGYAGNGGGGGASGSAGTAGAGGGGGGGGSTNRPSGLNGGGGGGVLLYGQGANGAAGTAGGGRGGGGVVTSNTQSTIRGPAPYSGYLWGGAGGGPWQPLTRGLGMAGAVRIVWPGVSRQFPTTDVADASNQTVYGSAPSYHVPSS